MSTKFFTFSRFVLLVALTISAIAAWYSVLGLTAIFAAAVIPIIIMGGTLEVAKIVTTVWLHRYWDRAGFAIRTYLTTAVIALAFLTSMGIFGFLSKAHSDQGLVSGDVIAKIAVYDEKIKTAKENIETNRKALKQLDEAVDQVMARSTTEQGADKAVQIRRQQAKERNRLLQEIEAEQKKISKLNEERAPIAAEVRKVEAEVGPIKYVAAIIYGDNPDANLLERAVRWVIIMIVVVFDPLAITLLLAANKSLEWERTDREEHVQPPPAPGVVSTYKPYDDSSLDFTHMTPWPIEPGKPEDPVVSEPVEAEVEPPVAEESTLEEEQERPNFSQWPEPKMSYDPWPAYFFRSWATEQPVVDKVADVEEVPEVQSGTAPEVATPENTPEPKETEPVIEIEGVTKEAELYSSDSGYVIHNGKKMSIEALKHLRPELIVQGPLKNQILFGSSFPAVAVVGDIYTRVDVNPHKTYKFNGVRWILIDRNQNTSYLQNVAYIQYLISKLESGEYDPENLTVAEQDEIQDYIKRTA